MKEIKYLSHLSRNIILSCGLYFTLNLLTNFNLTFMQFIFGALTFSVAYAPVYFFNDFIDHEEDKKDSKANLYNAIKNAKRYLVLGILLLITGIYCTYVLNPFALLFLLPLYLFNLLYSSKSIRIRNRLVYNVLCIFLIYIVKIYYVTLLLNAPIAQLPLEFIVMSGSVAALSVLFYKRHKLKQPAMEYLFSIMFFISWLLTLIHYHQLFLLYFPFIFILVHFHLRYKQSQIPIGIYQLLYFVYSTIVWLLIQ